MEQTLLWLLAISLVMVGLAGTILPMFPGIPFVFGGLLVAAWIDHFERVGWITLTVLGTLMLLAIAIDFIAGTLGAKRVGASPLALWGATIGAVVGIFFGFVGLFVGPFIGAFVGEFIAMGKLGNAGKVGFATWIGLLFGAVAKIAVSFVMVGIFVAAYLLNGT